MKTWTRNFIVENIIGAINRSNSSPEKKKELIDKALKAHRKEEIEAINREDIHPTKYTLKRYFSKRRLQDDALKQGDKTRLKKEALG